VARQTGQRIVLGVPSVRFGGARRPRLSSVSLCPTVRGERARYFVHSHALSLAFLALRRTSTSACVAAASDLTGAEDIISCWVAAAMVPWPARKEAFDSIDWGRGRLGRADRASCRVFPCLICHRAPRQACNAMAAALWLWQ